MTASKFLKNRSVFLNLRNARRSRIIVEDTWKRIDLKREHLPLGTVVLRKGD